MADNIRILGNVNDIRRINRLKIEDLNLLNPLVKNQEFGFNEDYIEFFVYNINGQLLDSNYNYRSFKLPSEYYLNPNNGLPIIEIDPVIDLQNLGYTSGEFITQYNFQKRKISSPAAELFISKISSDRTEISINSTSISNLIEYGNQLVNELDTSEEQKYFILNSSNNTQSLIVNVLTQVDAGEVLFKLYEPLPNNVTLKSNVWVTEEIIEPYVFDLNLDTLIIPPPIPKLRGPNFSVSSDIKENKGTGYENYSSLVSSLTGSSYEKVLNYMKDKSYDLNIDYTSYSNFIHFSSAKTRLEVFLSKLQQIEDLRTTSSSIENVTHSLQTTLTSSIQAKIDNIISNFDGFETYLYFESSSYSWPKNNSSKPYSNKLFGKKFNQTTLSTTWSFSHNQNETINIDGVFNSLGNTLVTSSASFSANDVSIYFPSSQSGYAVLSSPLAATWLTSSLTSSINYDESNLDYLYYSLPEYIKNDSDNYQSYFDFIDMIGHYFDNIWIYITSINELYNADNNLEKGVSKDIVYDVLRSLGVKLYNSKKDDNFDQYIYGLNSGSTLFTDDFTTGSEYLNNIPKKDLLAESYKRIFHNIPLLSKQKGTYAGLQNLINTFGISSSIFSPKEFGGSTKINEIKGYDNDKITIQNNTITGSVLSPITSLQTTPTASSEFTSTDLHFVDVSFSPQNELNERISASIASNNPTFSLDEYIGDPGYAESSSYDSLISQNEYYISASSAISGSAKKLDYKGFIELVKYFDNSLFKMLKDFVPARTNTLTGITIKSPILERNKIPQYKPNVTKETTYEANYGAPVISEDRDYHYDFVEGNKSAFYNGEFSGSYANINELFETSNPNEYIKSSSLTDAERNVFNHSDFNVTLNNVSSSVSSINRKKLERIYTVSNSKVYLSGSNNELTSSVELQDSNLSLRGFENSRYNGTKIFSSTYNTYTSASANYSGDNSYGKTAVIDHYTKKLGLFSQVKENTYFNSLKRNDVALKYLVNESGSLTELNSKNKNWYELQNTFKSGETLTVSLFDNQKYGNQKRTEGIKTIFNSGYSYSPILYYSGSDTNLYFNYTSGEIVSTLFKISTTGGYISGSTSDLYPITDSNIYKLFSGSVDIFDELYADGNQYYTHPGTTNFPTYSIQDDGEQSFTGQFNINTEVTESGKKGSFTFNITKVGTGVIATQTKSFTGSAAINELGDNTDFKYVEKLGSPQTITYTTDIYSGGIDTGSDLSIGEKLYKVKIYFDGNPSVCQFEGGQEAWVIEADYNNIVTSYVCSGNSIYSSPSGITYYSAPTNILSQTLSFNKTSPFQNFNIGDEIGFEFIANTAEFNTTNFTASISAGGVLYNQINANQSGDYPYATNSLTPFVSGSTSDNTITLSSELTSFRDYVFTPSGSGFTANSLYPAYNDVDYSFSPKIGDIILIYYGGAGAFTEVSITNVTTTNSKLVLTLNKDLPSALTGDVYTNNTIDKLLLLSKIENETNLIINFDKPSGNTSLGLIIPSNIHPDVLNNIDAITKEVKQKLIDAGGLLDAGGF